MASYIAFTSASFLVRSAPAGTSRYPMGMSVSPSVGAEQVPCSALVAVPVRTAAALDHQRPASRSVESSTWRGRPLRPCGRGVAFPGSIHCGCLERYEQVWPREPGNAEQGAREAHAGAVEALGQDAEVLEQGVDVGGVDVEPDDVAEVHVGAGEDCFEVVECEAELGCHVAGML